MMPIGSVLGGLLATTGLRTPLYVGGAIATVIALFSIKFMLSIGSTLNVEKK
jgi:hypothetical protein